MNASAARETVHGSAGLPRPQVIAHRGLSSRFPENTIPAYQAAIAAGADLVELDFYSTSDGVLVCNHDGKLNRYLAPDAPARAGLVDRPIRSFTLAELQAIDVGGWKDSRFKGARIPTLEEVLQLFLQADGRSLPTLVLEQKEGTPEQLLTLLARYEGLERVVAQSFNWDFVRGMHALEPRVPLAALGGRPLTEEVLREIPTTGAMALHWDQQAVTLESVRQAHALGLQVWSYTPNSEMAWRGAQLMGLDGITTDHCDKALAVYSGHPG